MSNINNSNADPASMGYLNTLADGITAADTSYVEMSTKINSILNGLNGHSKSEALSVVNRVISNLNGKADKMEFIDMIREVEGVKSGIERFQNNDILQIDPFSRAVSSQDGRVPSPPRSPKVPSHAPSTDGDIAFSIGGSLTSVKEIAGESKWVKIRHRESSKTRAQEERLSTYTKEIDKHLKQIQRDLGKIITAKEFLEIAGNTGGKDLVVKLLKGHSLSPSERNDFGNAIRQHNSASLSPQNANAPHASQSASLPPQNANAPIAQSRSPQYQQALDRNIEKLTSFKFKNGPFPVVRMNTDAYPSISNADNQLRLHKTATPKDLKTHGNAIDFGPSGAMHYRSFLFADENGTLYIRANNSGVDANGIPKNVICLTDFLNNS